MRKMSFDKKSGSAGEKRAFYVALAVCLIAVGAGSASAYKNYRENKLNNTEISESSNIPESSVITENAANIISGVPYPDQDESSEPEPVSSKEDTVLSASSADESSSLFILPVGGSILKDYDGEKLQYSETYKDWRLHKGVDIAAPKGTAVFSASDGTVTAIREDSLLGTVVEIDHGNGLTGLYCGLNGAPSVKEGQSVEAGYQIGAIDEIPSESVEETHLHFEMKLNGDYVAPLKYMNMMD